MNRAFGTKAVLGMMAVLLVAGTASAGGSITSIVDFSNTPPIGTLNTGSDDSRELLIDLNGNGKADVGDTFRGILNINSMWNDTTNIITGIGGNSPNNEWTAIFQAVIVGKSATTNVNGEHDFAFGPSAIFAEANTLFGGASGAMFLFYEDAGNDFSVANGYDTDGTLGPAYVSGAGGTSDEHYATNGIFTWAIGFNGVMGLGADGLAASGDEYTSLGEGWHATAFETPAGVAGTDLGSGNIDANRVFGAGGSFDSWILDTFVSQFDASSGVEFRGDTQFQRPLSGSPTWPIENEAQINFKAIGVPVPSAVWMGLAMLGALGIGANRRRKRSA
jgi:hypothetical protein